MAIAAFLDLRRRDPQRARQLYDELNAQRERRFSGGTDYKDSTRHYYEIAHQDYLEVLEDFLAQVAA
jgi:hypothetical protein